MRLTGTLWKLRAKLTALMLPATMVDATEVKNRNVSGSIGCDSALGIDRRTYSGSPGALTCQRGPVAEVGAHDLHDADAQVQERADDRADGDAQDAHRSGRARRRPKTMPVL